MRLKLHEDAIRSKTRWTSAKKYEECRPRTTPRVRSRLPARPELQPLHPYPARMGPLLRHMRRAADLPRKKPPATPKSEDSGSVKSVSSTLPMDASTAYAVKARTEMVHRIFTVLREESRTCGTPSWHCPASQGSVRGQTLTLAQALVPTVRVEEMYLALGL